MFAELRYCIQAYKPWAKEHNDPTRSIKQPKISVKDPTQALVVEDHNTGEYPDQE